MKSDSHSKLIAQKALVRAATLLALSLLLALPAVSSAYYGDCGQADSNGSVVHSSDADYLLNTAVGNTAYPAPLCVGDVNSSGTITSSDALLVSQKAAGQAVTLTCASGSTCTACDESSIATRLAALNNDERVLAGTSTIFRCTPGTTITVSDTWASSVTADNVIVSARDRDLTFKRHTTCPGSQPTGGIRFLDLAGDDIVLEAVHIERFWNGVEVSGDNNTIRSVGLIPAGVQDGWIDYACNVAVLNQSNAMGTELRTLFITRTGKGVISQGAAINTTSPCTDANALYATSTSRSCYNLASYDTAYNGVNVPVQFTGKGRYLVKGEYMYPGAGAGYPCSGPVVDQPNQSDDVRARFESVWIDTCDTGARIKNGAQVAFAYGNVRHSVIRGVWTSQSSLTTLRDVIIRENGGTSAALSHYGGVTTSNGSPYVDMGVSPDSGDNTLCGNRDPSGYVQIDNDAGTITNYGNTITNGACF